LGAAVGAADSIGAAAGRQLCGAAAFQFSIQYRLQYRLETVQHERGTVIGTGAGVLGRLWATKLDRKAVHDHLSFAATFPVTAQYSNVIPGAQQSLYNPPV